MEEQPRMMTEEKLNFNLNPRQQLLVVLSGLSGSGKDTVLKALKEQAVPFSFVVTAASRPPRDGEVEGVDYHFVSREEFQMMIDKGDLLEYAQVYEEFKGVPRQQLEKALATGEDVFLRVDVQGAASIRKLYPQAILIFLVPGSYVEWIERLVSRNTETPDKLKVRIATAKRELEMLPIFDYVITNQDKNLQEAVRQVLCIIQAEHHKLVGARAAQ